MVRAELQFIPFSSSCLRASHNTYKILKRELLLIELEIHQLACKVLLSDHNTIYEVISNNYCAGWIFR